VTTCSADASHLGIYPGMSVGQARSLLPRHIKTTHRSPRRQLVEPIFKRADPDADVYALRQLALHCQRYSPLTGLEDGAAPESLWLDIAGSEQLFGGETGLVETMRADFAQQGLQTRIAIADSWGAAWAVSHFGDMTASLVPASRQSEALSALPVASLRIANAVVESLRVLDVVTIGQLMRLSRSSLPSRFGQELVQRLDQALGLAPELLTAERSVEPISAQWLFEEPISDRLTLDRVCEVLLERLLTTLDQRQVGLRELVCEWVGAIAEPTLLRLLRPTTDRRHWFEMFRLQCEQRVFEAAVNGVRMQAAEIGLPAIRQRTLFGNDPHENHTQVLTELVDRLTIRLGPQAVLRVRLVPDPQPEFACESTSWLEEEVEQVAAVAGKKRSSSLKLTTTAVKLKPGPRSSQLALAGVEPSPELCCRPLRLLRSPRTLSIQTFSAGGLPTRVNHSPVIRISRPERIETGWWRGLDIKRDYYRLDLAVGTGLWVFINRNTADWFLHGLFE